MPIRFRCSYCNRLLGIATRKAGMETTCPHCGYTITVPLPQEDNDRTERLNFEDVEAALGRGVTDVAAPAAGADAPGEQPRPPDPPAPPKPPAVPKPIPPEIAKPKPPVPPPAKPKPVSNDPNERPLFEKDMEDIFGKTAVPVEPEKNKPKKVSGMDALSLSEPTQNIVLSPQKATFLMIGAVVLMVLSFVAGYMVK